ncbi:hypothetical protein D9M68_280970 [compost metagenome]
MVGADHQAVVGVGDGELGDHADARLDVAGDEVATGVGQVVQVGHLVGEADHGVGDVHRFFFVGANEVHGHLGVRLVVLDVVGQAHGDEAVAVIAGLGTQFLDAELGQAAGGGGVDAAADAEYQHLEAGVAQAVLDEGLAALDLGHQGGFVGEGRDNVQGFGDFLLAIAAHVRSPYWASVTRKTCFR